MKKLLWLLSVMSILILDAKTINLTPQQIESWQIKTQTVKHSKSLPLGEFIATVTTPPQLLHTITIPFEAQIKELFVANYDEIKEGQVLAMVTGEKWIEIQQKFIEDAIELKHHGHLSERKNRLCYEGIIPKKECHSADAEHQADKIKVSASKALLREYGAEEQMIESLFEELKISPTVPLRSDINGILLHLNVRAGKSTNPSDALFVIQKKGALWLEADILVEKAMKLKKGQSVKIKFNGNRINSRVLLHSPVINPENQTQKVRFSLPNSSKFISGMRSSATIIVSKKTLKIQKKAVININDKSVVFLVVKNGYKALAVDILGEEGEYYFIKNIAKLNRPIATSSLLILKSLMEGEDE